LLTLRVVKAVLNVADSGTITQPTLYEITSASFQSQTADNTDHLSSVSEQFLHSTIRLYSVIHVGTRWKIQDRRQINNTDDT